MNEFLCASCRTLFCGPGLGFCVWCGAPLQFVRLADPSMERRQPTNQSGWECLFHQPRRVSPPAPTDEAQRAALARSVYQAITHSTESLEDDDLLGPDLAYLLGAILCDTRCEWPPDRAIIQRLRQAFPPTHPVWEHISLEPKEGQP